MIKRILHFAVIVVLASCSYLPDEAADVQGLNVKETMDYIFLTSSDVDYTKAGVMFYPGGLVDPHAYIDMLKEFVLVDERPVVILKVTSNLAILNSQKSAIPIEDYTAVKRWVVGGHSLGGAVACMDVSKNLDQFDGLFLLAAYSVNDLSRVGIPVLSITGSEDKILDQEKFTENIPNLPSDQYISSPADFPTTNTGGLTIYLEIQGGNHGQFGNYGTQNGDGVPGITAEEQQTQVLNTIRNFFASNQL